MYPRPRGPSPGNSIGTGSSLEGCLWPRMLEFGISHASAQCSDCRSPGSSEPVPDLLSPIVGGGVAQPPVHLFDCFMTSVLLCHGRP